MLDYLYRQVYDDYELLKEVKAQRSQGQVDRHDGIATIPTYVNAMMSVTANKYAIRGLKDLAEKKLVANLMHEWNDAYFIQLVEYVYGANASADPKLEGIVAQFATRHISTLKGFQSFHDALHMWHRFAYLFSREMMERVIQLEKGVA
ncbi:hypothetical protein BDV36DRAFT_308176 [Aspergillus pseudocaelatus]|nr:hypothetical protein BDV36DRAFT_308176 [Aspergillus pseudocaelatus]